MGFIPAGFFVLRSPLLPFDELTAWSEGLQANAVIAGAADSLQLEDALSSDRSILRARLQDIVARPEIREAIFIASPDLDATIPLWLKAPFSDRGQKIERSLIRYFVRMAGRPTPFGLFAGVSTGTLDSVISLTLPERNRYLRHTRLDMDYLYVLQEMLARDSILKRKFLYRPNSTLYYSAEKYRYVEVRLREEKRSYHLVAVEDDELLSHVLQESRNGIDYESLIRLITREEVSEADAEGYMQELIDAQVLVPDFGYPVTGPEPIHWMIETVEALEKESNTVRVLKSVRDDLKQIDSSEPGISPDRYREIASVLGALPAKIELPRLFQVDMIKPSNSITFDSKIADEVLKGIHLLQSISHASPNEELQQFRDRFTQRYESQELPLLQVLDEETGIGFGTGREPSPLLEGIDIAHKREDKADQNSRTKFLLRKLSEALQYGQEEIVLQPEDLETLKAKQRLPLPDAFSASIRLIAKSSADLLNGNYQIFLEGVQGPSGAQILGRFCHGDEKLRNYVRQMIQKEEAVHPDVIYAEIVHLPEGRMGNILSRPLLRKYEIVCMGFSGLSEEFQITVDDLLVTIHENRIVLRSKRLQKEIVPRITSAHNFGLSTLGIYRFLCSLQFQNVSLPHWSWGALADSLFLPRVRLGRFILNAAEWKISKAEIKELLRNRDATQFRDVQAWRKKRRLPRWVLLTDYDNLLPIDLDNALSIDTFVSLIKEREVAALREMLPSPEQLCVQGPEGNYQHEIILPFVQETDASQTSISEFDTPALAHLIETSRNFPPGSEWLYLKLYTGTATADTILTQSFSSLLKEVIESGKTRNWFFIRYGDPDSHLRIRFEGDPHALHSEVEPLIHKWIRSLMESNQIWKVQFDTYQREIERYGGPTGILLAEHFFQIDSEAVLEILQLVEQGDEGLAERWKLGLRGADLLLDDFGFDLEQKLTIMKNIRNAMGIEFDVQQEVKQQMATKLREQKKVLSTLLQKEVEPEHPLHPGFEILRGRSEKMKSIVQELKSLQKKGELTVDLKELVTSYIHMSLNRILRSVQREQECVIYDFLEKSYQSMIARAK